VALIKLTRAVEVETDTDTWTQGQWSRFIRDWVPSKAIIRVCTEGKDLFPLETLKELALHAYALSQDLEREFRIH
jgi:hypothetical protein